MGTLWKKYFCGGLAYVLVAVDWVVRVHSTTHPQGMKKPPLGRLFVEARAFNYRDEASTFSKQVWLLLGVLQQWAPMAHWKPGWHL